MKFIANTDFEFFQHVNREIAAEIIETLVILYKLNLDHTKTNLYGESSEKVHYTGAELPANIVYNENVASTDDGFGVDQKQEVEFRFVRRILAERHVYPEIGDIVGYNNAFYEIDNIKEVQLIAGRPEYNHAISCTAHLTRRTSIQLETRQV